VLLSLVSAMKLSRAQDVPVRISSADYPEVKQTTMGDPGRGAAFPLPRKSEELRGGLFAPVPSRRSPADVAR
jgi:uncharacterized protein (DUF779 family)